MAMTHLSSFARARKEGDPQTKDGPLHETRKTDAPRADTRERRCQELSFTVKPRPGESFAEMLAQLAFKVKESDATLLKLIIYGPVNAATSGMEAMQRVFGEINWPITWVEGGPCDENPIAGIQAFASTGGTVDRIILDGRAVGSVFSVGGARFYLLGSIGPDQIIGTGADQTQRTFDQMQKALAQADFSIGDIIRTWFFLDDLLSWYDAFNEVRTRLYAQTNFRFDFLPASTGVAGRNPAGAALIAGARAMQPLEPSARTEEVFSPLQCPAPQYGSSFSRALEITCAGSRRLLVSGTASIEPGGHTAHVGHVRGQIELSMQVVEAILESRRMSFADVTRATAYFKSATDAPAFAEWRDRRELRKLPVVTTCCDICRRDLLFEIELDAVQAMRTLAAA
jgi:enamine deaminase RidA (YjgF/YER057c/UK114 family)